MSVHWWLTRSTEIMDWLECTDFTTLYKDRHLPNLFPNVGEEPLKSDEFKNWCDGTTKWLWCHGMRKCILKLRERGNAK